MKKVDVSVIVPVYNVEKYLEKCLDSLINQNFDNYEIIVVNDGSPDNSQKIIDKYVKKYPDKVVGYIKKNGGLSDARNYGLSKAQGEYILFVDSDDFVSKDYIRRLYNTLINGNYDMVICDFYETYIDKKNILSGLNERSDDIFKNAIISLPAACNKIYKKKLFIDNNIKYPKGIFYEDLATTSRLIVNCNNIGYVNKSLYYYVQRDNSIMNQIKYNPKNSDVFKSLEILVKYFKENNFYSKYREEIEFLYITHLLHDFSLRVYKYDEGLDDINNIISYIKDNYPNWRKNKYYKNESIKYKIVCLLIYKNKISVLRKILK